MHACVHIASSIPPIPPNGLSSLGHLATPPTPYARRATGIFHKRGFWISPSWDFAIKLYVYVCAHVFGRACVRVCDSHGHGHVTCLWPALPALRPPLDQQGLYPPPSLPLTSFRPLTTPPCTPPYSTPTLSPRPPWPSRARDSR